jgi:IS5 family transposase
MYLCEKNTITIMKTIQYKQTGKVGIFDKDLATAKLSKLGNPLEKLHKVIDFEIFRPELEATMLNHEKTSNAGQKPLDVVLLFKIILLKRCYNLSDEQTEYQIVDRLSFREFLGLASGDRVPDARTIWLFQDKLITQKLDETLFEKFKQHLDNLGLYVNEGKIIDASFVEVPRQHNKPDENVAIKAGNGDKLWDNAPHKKRQKDVDARWTEKGGEKHFGYKDHAKIDAKSKLIDTYVVTSASVHDSKPTKDLVRDSDSGQELYADSAYIGDPIDSLLKEKGIIPQITERAFKGKPLTDSQKATNRIKSKTRSRVEHIFGFVTQNMGDFKIKSIGFKRARGIIGLINLTYNMCRYEQIVRLNLLPIKNDY